MSAWLTGCLWVLISCTTSWQFVHREIESIEEVTAVVTGTARLPCDLRYPPDPVTLVIWYKDYFTAPIYSLDARGVETPDKGTHWADKALGNRAFFRKEVDTWHLVLQEVKETDQGSYRCRVDLQGLPTRNYFVNLSVVVPPRGLWIADLNSTRQGPILGPYVEGATVRLICTAKGGRPAPRISWWGPAGLLDDLEEQPGVSNVLTLQPLGRHHQGKTLTCYAINTDLVPALVANVTLDIYLLPLEVRLLGENLPLSAASEYEVACQASGAKPSATISWWKSGLRLEHTREITSADGNVTTSTLTLAPQVEDSGKVLSCRAENPLVPGRAVEDSWILSVLHPPLAILKIGSNLNASHIWEGVDVYLECDVKANPWIYRLIWKHNDEVVQPNTSRGVIFSNQSLVLQGVDRTASGFYTCVASNTEGETESLPFLLDIKYGPVCKAGQQLVYGAGRHENVRVKCEVDANPPAGLFRWSFNNSVVQADLEPGSVLNDPDNGVSIATYTPTSERDFGTLLCWGHNEMGFQNIQCVFHVVPAGKPDSPRNCALVNRTHTLVHVLCVKGFDGGLPQDFTMELFAADHRRLISNVTSRSRPEFTVTGLEPGTGYFVSIYSTNDKGRSGVFTLSVSTLKSTQHEHHRNTVRSSDMPQTISPLLWLLTGIIMALGITGLVAIAMLRSRSHRRRSRSAALPKQTSVPPVKGAVITEDTDDRNPDLIAHTTEAEYPVTAQDLNIGYDTVGRPVGAVQPTQTLSYTSIPDATWTKAIMLTQTVNAETQTPVHKESTV